MQDINNINNGQTQGNILVLGGTGKTGRRVAERLEAMGQPVRIGSRSAEPPFEWDVPTTWQPVLRGIDSVYVLYQPELSFPGAAETVEAFARLAVESGVKRLVLLSARNEEGAAGVEQAVQAAGAEWTIVRAATFAQNFTEGAFRDAILAGELAFVAGDVLEPFIDVEDIADVAVAALTSDGHAGRIYEVTGPALLTFAEAVAEISRASGRDISYVQVPPEAFLEGLTQSGAPREFAAELTDLFVTLFDGRNASVAGGVRQALGREPRDFATFAREAAANGAWDAPVKV